MAQNNQKNGKSTTKQMQAKYLAQGKTAMQGKKMTQGKTAMQGKKMTQGKTSIRTGKSGKSLLGTILTVVILAIYVSPELTGTQKITAENREQVELVRVVDGDTIIVNYQNEQTRVRLIGINSPESVHQDESKNTQEGRDASAFLKEYLADVDTVWLEFDVEARDQYERVLAYVWMNADGTDVGGDMLNGIIVKNGYAEARAYEPNVKYQDALEDVEHSR